MHQQFFNEQGFSVLHLQDVCRMVQLEENLLKKMLISNIVSKEIQTPIHISV